MALSSHITSYNVPCAGVIDYSNSSITIYHEVDPVGIDVSLNVFCFCLCSTGFSANIARTCHHDRQ